MATGHTKKAAEQAAAYQAIQEKKILILCVIHEEKKNWQVNYVFKEY